MFKSTCFLLVSSALALASPCAPKPKTPVLPRTDGDNLPQPPPGSKLLHIALGFGIQNYTCSSVGANPAATGALAMLYDITNLYPGRSSKSVSQQEWNSLPSRALWSHGVPLNFNSSVEGRVDPSSPGASQTDPFPAADPLQLAGLEPLPFLGNHLFNLASLPNFLLDGSQINVLCAKAAAVQAPMDADKGPQGTGAVAWLLLVAKDDSVGGVRYIYRVLTSGGNSHGCVNAAGQDSTSYTAMYWLYG